MDSIHFTRGPTVDEVRVVKDLAARKIQAVFRRHLHREAPINPSHIASSLAFRYLPFDFIRHQLFVIVHQVNRVVANKKHWGAWYRMKTAGVDLYYGVSPHANFLHIQFRLLSTCWQREGTYKKVYPAHSFTFKLDRQAGRRCVSRISITPSVRIEMKEEKLNLLVKRGMRFHEMLYKQKPDDVYLTKPLKKLFGMLFEQTWYQSDLHRVLRSKSIPADIVGSGKSKPISVQEILFCLRDVASSVNWLHQEGFVHSDLSHRNLFISNGIENQRCIGYIGDFDYLGPFGYEEKSASSYSFWDPCYQFSDIRTPFCDLHAIVVNLLFTLNSRLEDTEIIAFRDAVHRDTQEGAFKPAYAYLRGHICMPGEYSVWQLLHLICWESSSVLKKLTSEYKCLNEIDAGAVKKAIKAHFLEKGANIYNPHTITNLIDRLVSGAVVKFTTEPGKEV